MTSVPGDFTVSVVLSWFVTLAAMDRLSLPPSTAMPSLIIRSRIATAASYKRAPSPGSFGAHIQLAEQRMSSSLLTCAQMMVVIASPTPPPPPPPRGGAHLYLS